MDFAESGRNEGVAPVAEMEKIRFILQVLTVADNADSASAVLSRYKDADWEELSRLAESHNVAGLFYFHLKEKRLVEALPGQVIDRLRWLYHQQSARNLRLFHELGRVLDCLREARLPAVLLKGAFLAARVYANPALRGMQDLDILMQTQDIPAAIDRLKSLGYRPAIPPWVDSLRFHVMLVAAEHSVRLEIHWDLVNPNAHYRMPAEELWAHAERIDFEGRRELALCPEHLTLHLCEHSALKHMFMLGCRPLVDMDRSVRRLGDQMNWEMLASLSSDWGLGRAVGLSMSLCRQHLNTPVPDGALEALNCQDIDPQIVRDAWSQISGAEGLIEATPTGLYRVQAEKKTIKKIRLLIHHVFTLPLPPYQARGARSQLLTPYYVFRRILYLITEHGRTIWNLAWNRQGRRRHHKGRWMLVQWLQKCR